MVKKRLFVIVFLLFLPSVLSLTEESLYSGTVEDDEKVNAGNFEFEFKVASEGGVFIRYDGKGIIIMEGDCKYRDNLHFCVGDISWAYRNMELWKDIYQAEVDIWALKGELDITKNIEKTRLLIDDTSQIETLLQNTGSEAIQNVVFKDDYPDSIRIANIEGCSFNKKNNGVEWEGDLAPQVKKSCSYTLSGLQAVKHDSKAEASYFDGVTVQNAYSDEVEIEVRNYSLQTETSLSKDRVGIGEPVNFSIVLENINNEEEISVLSFKVDIPATLKILKKSRELNKKGNILSWRGDIEINEKKNLTMELQAIRTGNTPIYIEKQYKVGEFTRKFTETPNMNVYCDCLTINYEVSDEIVPGKETNFKVYLLNPSFTNKFKDIKINVFSNIPFADQISNFYSVLDKGKSIMLYDYNIIVPEGGSYYYNISVNYKSEYGQYFKDKKHILIKEGVVEEIEEALNETTIVKAEIEEKETEENATEEEIETTVVNIKDENFPLNYILMGLIALIIFVIVAGIVKIKKLKKEIPPTNSKPPPSFTPPNKSKPPNTPGAAFTFLFLIALISLSYLFSTSNITGFVVNIPNFDHVQQNLSLLGAMAIISVFLLLVVYRREPFRKP